jgi:hypothetical protein
MTQQIRVSLLLLAAIAATALGIRAGSYSPRLNAMVNQWDLEQFKKERVHMMNAGMFIEFEDRLILDELPRADYSRGGVYFFGTSALKWSLATWELPPELRGVIGNYGIGGSSHELQFAFIRHMIEQRGLLRAGPGKVHIVIGMYYSMGQNWKASGYFKPLWERYGLYTYDDQAGIQTAGRGGWDRWLRAERARAAGFLSSNATRAARAVTVALGIPLSATEKLRNPQQVRLWAQRLSNDSGAGLPRQMEALRQMIEYLKARGVGVTALFVPERAPFAELPEPVAYHKQADEVCQRAGIPVLDLSRFLAEDEYWDINHSNYKGLMRTHNALIDLARDRLARMGVVANAKTPGQE